MDARWRERQEDNHAGDPEVGAARTRMWKPATAAVLIGSFVFWTVLVIAAWNPVAPAFVFACLLPGFSAIFRRGLMARVRAVR